MSSSARKDCLFRPGRSRVCACSGHSYLQPGSGGWSQRRLEWASGVDQTTISRLENGRLRSLRLTRIGDLMAALCGDWRIFPVDPSLPDANNGIASRED